jgi:hypothetical protein
MKMFQNQSQAESEWLSWGNSNPAFESQPIPQIDFISEPEEEPLPTPQPVPEAQPELQSEEPCLEPDRLAEANIEPETLSKAFEEPQMNPEPSEPTDTHQNAQFLDQNLSQPLSFFENAPDSEFCHSRIGEEAFLSVSIQKLETTMTLRQNFQNLDRN